MIFSRNRLKSILNGWRMLNKRWQLVECFTFIGLYWYWSHWMLKIIFLHFTAHIKLRNRIAIDVNSKSIFEWLSTVHRYIAQIVPLNSINPMLLIVQSSMWWQPQMPTWQMIEMVRLLEDSREFRVLRQSNWSFPWPLFSNSFPLNKGTRPPSPPPLSPPCTRLHFPRRSLHSANTSATFFKYLPQKCVESLSYRWCCHWTEAERLKGPHPTKIVNCVKRNCRNTTQKIAIQTNLNCLFGAYHLSHPTFHASFTWFILFICLLLYAYQFHIKQSEFPHQTEKLNTKGCNWVVCRRMWFLLFFFCLFVCLS